jgi:propionyl-CoA synthetase
MFSAPTAIRVLKKQDPAYLKKYDLSSLRHLFLAGEPLDEPTAKWIAEALGKPIYDHYWQTETGWALLTGLPGIEPHADQVRQPLLPRLRLRRAPAARRHRRGGRRPTRRASSPWCRRCRPAA